MLWIPDSKAQDPEFLHQNFQDSKQKNSAIADLDSLARRERWPSGKSIYCRFPLKDRGRLLESIAKSSHLKMGKEGRSVYLYVDLYLLGWQRSILESEDSTIPRRTLLYSRFNSKCLWERIVRDNFRLKVVVEKAYLSHKVNMWSAQPLPPWKSSRYFS